MMSLQKRFSLVGVSLLIGFQGGSKDSPLLCPGLIFPLPFVYFVSMVIFFFIFLLSSIDCVGKSIKFSFNISRFIVALYVCLNVWLVIRAVQLLPCIDYKQCQNQFRDQHFLLKQKCVYGFKMSQISYVCDSACFCSGFYKKYVFILLYAYIFISLKLEWADFSYF